MSVRFTATTQRYSATTGIPAGNVFTATCWAYISVSRATYSALWSLSIPAGYPNPRTECTTSSDGTTLTVVDSAPILVGAFANTVGTWFRLGVVINGASCTVYCAPVGSALTSASSGSFAPNSAPTFLSIGTEASGAAAFFNGRIAAFKMWQAVLTLAEVTAELAQFAPVRAGNLLRYHPFHVAETADYSGNGNTLAGGTGATTEADPPIPEAVPPWQQVVVNRAALIRASSW